MIVSDKRVTVGEPHPGKTARDAGGPGPPVRSTAAYLRSLSCPVR
jgi:hypothetical protein